MILVGHAYHNETQAINARAGEASTFSRSFFQYNDILEVFRPQFILKV